ncbi:MAG: helix-turn-helix transcriptional regulator [Chloroflexi bacterium]|nr:helix-turn-helix transcriptional regulator [Chloroflexota bacterium]
MPAWTDQLIVRLKLLAYNHRLVEMRRAKRLTMGDLARRSGLSRGRLSEIELLKDMPTEYEKDFVAGALESDPVWLFPAGLVRLQGGCRELCLTGEEVARLIRRIPLFGSQIPSL